MKKLLVILGPTATGKTDLALTLAKKYNGELISCDSRQVYIGLDIGTGKLPGKNVDFKKEKGYWEMDGIKVWMYDVADPNTQYTVFEYVKDAQKVLKDILRRGKLPIIVGGTGFYIKALLEGIPNLSIPVDPTLRGELIKLSKEELQEKLKHLSPSLYESLNNSEKNNPRRLLRSIEIVSMNGYVDKVKSTKLKVQNYDVLKIGLTASREVLNSRIDLRVLSRLDQGMIEEAEKLHRNGLSYKRMREFGLEYRCLADLLDKQINKEEFVEKLKIRIHQFAKRQLTWFKNPSASPSILKSSGLKGSRSITWFDITGKNFQQKLEKIVDFWYYQEND